MSDTYEDRCPICRTKWKVTHFGVKVWKDCLTCGDKAENLIAKAKEEAPSHKYEGADWLQQEAWPQYYGMPVIEEDDDWDDEIPFFKVPSGDTYKVSRTIYFRNGSSIKLDLSEDD